MDAGFIFVRTGLDGADREFQATTDAVIATELATVLGDSEGPLVSTAEHVLAALRGMGVDNAVIEVDGPEVPIMDGSAAPFVAAIEQAGIVTQSAVRRFIQVLKPVQVAIGDSFGELRPFAGGFRAEVEIDFANPAIGRQSYCFDLSPESFRRDISRARTFGCMNDVLSWFCVTANAGFLALNRLNASPITDTRAAPGSLMSYDTRRLACVRHAPRLQFQVLHSPMSFGAWPTLVYW